MDSVRQAQAGDQGAWKELLERFRPMLQRLADHLAHGQSAELSGSDLVQEAWLRVFQGLNGFQGTNGGKNGAATFCCWVRSTARRAMLNVCIARNTQKRQPPGKQLGLKEGADSAGSTAAYHIPTANGKSPSEFAVDRENASRIREAMEQRLDVTDRMIIELAFFDGLPLRQISEMSSIGYDRVRRRFHQALSTLQDEIDD